MADMNKQEVTPATQQVTPSTEQLSYLWNEYKYRHGLCWKAVYKIVAVVVVLTVLPYARPDVTKLLGYWMVIPSLLGTLFAAFGVFIVNNELRLFAKTKVAHHCLENRFLSTVFRESDVMKESDVKKLVGDDMNPSNARWTPFDIYVHLLIIVLFFLSLGNTLFLAFSWIPNRTV